MNIQPSWLQPKQKCLEILDFINNESKLATDVESGDAVRTALEKTKVMMATLTETKASLRFYYKTSNTAENDALYNRAVDLFDTLSKSIYLGTTILSYNKQEKLLER